jgi:hypothetical protein
MQNRASAAMVPLATIPRTVWAPVVVPLLLCWYAPRACRALTVASANEAQEPYSVLKVSISRLAITRAESGHG